MVVAAGGDSVVVFVVFSVCGVPAALSCTNNAFTPCVAVVEV